ncbi:MAG: hypothetical protein PVH64_13535 [Bacillota bacterium]|jgi:hypothetical protein
MTTRERMIWITAGCLVGLAFVSNLGYRNWEQLKAMAGPKAQLQEARRLLGAEANIRARRHAVTGRLAQLRKRFFRQGQSRQTKLELLRLVEERAVRCGLSVQLKKPVVFSAEELGVSLEGTAPAATIVAFLQQLTAAPLELKMKRVQLHSVPEQKVLNYQITVSTLIAE